MYEQLNKNAYLDKVINMVDKFREELVAMKQEATATTVEGIIEHEGLKLRKVNREAQEGDYVRPNEQTGSHSLNDGEIYGPVTNNNTVKGNGSFTYTLYGPHNRTPSTVEVFEVVEEIKPEDLPFPEVEMTANQRRAVLIENAKAFVEETTNGMGSYIRNRKGNYSFRECNTHPKFYVNKEKQIVTALVIDDFNKEIREKGFAKCAPGDVFNEHIGRAIALARALEIDVPEEFLKAVQPNEIVMGMDLEIRSNGKLEFDHKPINVIDLEDCNKDFQADEYGTFIIDDTNAKYDEVN